MLDEEEGIEAAKGRPLSRYTIRDAESKYLDTKRIETKSRVMLRRAMPVA
jgi:hypothetical protein